MEKLPVALQLYSVKHALSEDFEGTLKAVAAMGYVGVEFAGLFGRDPLTVRELCQRYGLDPISAHVPYPDMVADPEGALGDYAAIGCRYVAIPWYTWAFDTETCEEFFENVRMLGRVAREKGMTLLYHNHDFEFERAENGAYRLDNLYGAVPADLLQTELDTCWVNVGGENPVDYLKKYAGRAPIVHLKDFAGQKEGRVYALIGSDDGDAGPAAGSFEYRPLGYGLQNMPAILDASVAAGAQWLVVEQDAPSMEKDELECARMSREYLKTLGY